MSTVTLQEAQATLPDLLDAATRGEEVIIERDGVPTVRLVPEPQTDDQETPGQRMARGLGMWKGQFEVPSWEEWKRMDAEIEADFEESLNKPFP